ncbi:SpoIIIAH-like family protein [Thalassobacillus sp. CUG 92003]|uniref:SpoIIIAH-like family protein n=1 Tax=Thalassobacillus sp. CUG 92003 TaxID=2736641 RepID=UPI0015E79013|nr:SpoIIIAH-like family protein [Thalassobacillus sp. CUG 92003]
MLKKQTVWLMTMLSLLIVLSVYYMTAPEGEEMAFLNEEDLTEQESGEEGDAPEEEGTEEGNSEGDTVISQMSSDELFTSVRMELQTKRDQQEEQLSEIVASSDFTAEEKNEAMEEMQVLRETRSKESILENTIQASNQYEDVLVRAEEDTIHVTVQVDELNEQETNHIIQMVADEFGHTNIEVQFQPVS